MVEEKKDQEFFGVDWCEDTLRKELPWDSDQFVEVRRMTGKEERKRQAIAARFQVMNNSIGFMEVEMATDRVKAFDWQSCITDFRLKDNNGKVLLFGKPSENEKIFDHIKGKLADFIDDLISSVNKWGEKNEAELEDMLKNSGSSSQSS